MQVKPSLSLGKVLPYIIVLIFGLVIFLVSFSPDTLFLRTNQLNAPVSLISQGQFILEKRGDASLLLLGAASTAMITVCLFELVKLIVEYAIWHTSRREALNTFFGDGAVTLTKNAEIILQADKLSDSLKEIADTDLALKSRTSNRMYKARSWINRFDMEAARQIVNLFRDQGLPTPKINQVDRGVAAKPDKIPFKIFLGLGFTDGINELITSEKFDAWIRIAMTEHGDALQIREDLLPRGWKSRLVGTETNLSGEFITLLPKNWSLDNWLTGPEQNSVRDYAVILRHTGDAGGTQKLCTNFWLGGFTERGTAAAGRYLAENWLELHSRFVQKKEGISMLNRIFFQNRKRGEGDFMIIIEGPSHDKSPNKDRWSEVADFYVNPGRLRELNIKTYWTTRQFNMRS